MQHKRNLKRKQAQIGNKIGTFCSDKRGVFYSQGLLNLGHFVRCGQNWMCNWHQIGSYLGL